MTLTWLDIAFRLEPVLAQEAADAWSWMVPEQWTPLVCSMVGGIFLQKVDGHVHWLDTGTGLIKEVAASRSDFEMQIKTSAETVEWWFLSGLVEQLHAGGKRPNADQCYGYLILPVFAEGKYTVENLVVLPKREQLVGMADVHKQINALPNGSKVRVQITD